MDSEIKIKVCGLTREVDVDHVRALKADFGGFIVYAKSPRGIAYERAAELASRLPEGKRVVVDVETQPDDLKRLKELGFDYFQIHFGLEGAAEKVAQWVDAVGADRLWLAPRVAPEDPFPSELIPSVRTILVDTFSKTQAGGTGKVGDWERFRELQAKYPDTNWVLAGGLSPENIDQAIAETKTHHVDLNSGVESAPGIKDVEKLRRIFDRLR